MPSDPNTRFSEFIGTIMFLWFAFAGTQVAAQSSPNNILDPQRLLFISLSFGLGLMVAVWAHYRVSGGLFNPAVRVAINFKEGLVLTNYYAGHSLTMPDKQCPLG